MTRKIVVEDDEGNVSYEFPLPEPEPLKPPVPQKFANKSEVTVWFFYGKDKQDVVTIGKVLSAAWDMQREKYLYTVTDCPNVTDGVFVAWEYELTATEPEVAESYTPLPRG